MRLELKNANNVGRKNKLRKFAEVLSFPNVYECYDIKNPSLTPDGVQTVDLRGRWNEAHFKAQRPITLELACGGGEYVLALSQRYPDRHFIGVDIKGNRIWKGARAALSMGLTNAAFLRTRIEIIEHFFAPGEISEIWITFADPFPRKGQENRRLTAPFFLEKYRTLLAPGGLAHLKHDDPQFFDYTLETLRAYPGCLIEMVEDDIYGRRLPEQIPELGIQTLYESMHLAAGKNIRYLRFRFEE